MLRRMIRRLPRRHRAPTPADMTALALNAIGQCAYDRRACYEPPTFWVEWQDGKTHGAAGYCIAHAAILLTSRTTSYCSPAFPTQRVRSGGRHVHVPAPRFVVALLAMILR